MPIVHRPAAERGRTRLPWLDGRHSFSFGDYYDPSWTEWSALRVLNDDRVAPGGGFPTHPHRDMEILTWVLDGSLEHKDSMGTGAVIRPGEAQVMRAGTGVTHSEFNHSKSAPVRLLQIWFPPRTHGLKPGYQQRPFPDGELHDQLRAIVSPDGRDGSLVIDQDVVVYVARLSPEAAVTHAIAHDRGAWVQVARGDVTVNGMRLAEGDGAGVRDERLVAIASPAGGEVLVFDLP
jgi:redox-sensitive bicupin YhaK (pirin superfamily)